MNRIKRRTFLGISLACAAFPGAAREPWSSVEVPANALKRASISIRGKYIAYRAEAAEIVIRDSAGVPRATMFAVSYLAEKAHTLNIWGSNHGSTQLSHPLSTPLATTSDCL